MAGFSESAIVSVMAGAAVKSFAVLGIAWLCSILFRRHAASVRHLVWAGALGCLILLPVLSAITPQMRVAPLPAFLQPSVTFEASSVAGQTANEKGTGTFPSGSARGGNRMAWSTAFLVVWGLGSLLFLGGTLRSLITVRSLRRRAVAVDEALWRETAADSGLDKLDVLQTSRSGSPMAFGVFRPTILLPADFLAWTNERQRMVLMHEMAHVQRHDPLTHLLARVAVALYWWNPAAWAAWRELLKQRERAADDMVLLSGSKASDYAAHLLDIARSMRDIPRIAATAICMARRSQLEGRLLAILDERRRRTLVGAAAATGAAVLAIAVVIPLAAVRAQTPSNEARTSLETQEGSPAALITAADADRRAGRLADAEAQYTKAAALMGDRPEAAPAFVGLGIAALGRKDPAQAIDRFKTAQKLDPPNDATALMWLGIAEGKRDNPSQAEAYYRSAISRMEPSSSAAATVMELCATLVQQQGREAEAKDLLDRASAIRKALGNQVGPQPDPTKTVYRAGVDGVVAPKLFNKIEPGYSEEARIAKYQGTAVLFIRIDTDGAPRDIRVVRGLGLGLDDKAVEAISQWRFKPGEKDGQPVPVAAHIEINFRLQ